MLNSKELHLVCQTCSMICVFQCHMGNQAFVQCWYKIRHIWSGGDIHLCGVQWHLLTGCLHLVAQEGYSAGPKDSPAEKDMLVLPLVRYTS